MLLKKEPNVSCSGGLKTSPNRISILIPVFNRRELVGGAIDSALSQDIDGLEVIVVDNHSDDGTWEFLREFNDSRLRISRNDANIGLFGNFDRCASLASGEFTLFLCSDDRLEPGFLARALKQMQVDESTVLLSSRGRIIDETGRKRQLIADRFPPGRYEGRSVVPAWFWSYLNYAENPMNYPSGVIVRTAVLKRCLPFRAELGTVADIDMYLRILQVGDLWVSDEIGCLVMQHSRQAGHVARADGELILNHLALLTEFRSELEAVGIYDSINRQMSISALSSLLHVARHDLRAAYKLFRVLNRKPAQMLLAATRSTALICLDRMFGYRLTPYLKSASSG